MSLADARIVVAVAAVMDEMTRTNGVGRRPSQGRRARSATDLGRPKFVPMHILSRANEHLESGYAVIEMVQPEDGAAMEDFVRVVEGQPVSPQERLRAFVQKELAEAALTEILELSYEVEDDLLETMGRYFSSLSLRAPTALDILARAQEELAFIFVCHREAIASVLSAIKARADLVDSGTERFWRAQSAARRGLDKRKGEADEEYERRWLDAIAARLD